MNEMQLALLKAFNVKIVNNTRSNTKTIGMALKSVCDRIK